MNNAKPEAVYLNRIFMKWHHMAKEFWRFNKGTNGCGWLSMQKQVSQGLIAAMDLKQVQKNRKYSKD